MDPAQWFTDIVNRLLDFVILPILGGLIIIMFLWAGILFLTAQGDPTKVKKAKDAVIYAVIGIIVAIVAFSAVGLVKTLIGAP